MCLNPPVRVPVIQRVRWCWRAGSPASHSSLFFPFLLAPIPHTVTFLFPISTCYMHCFPSFLPLPSTVLCKPSVFLSRLILRHRETQISPLSTHSRLVEVQLMKLTLNLSNLSLDVAFLKPCHRFTVYYVSQFLAQGDLPQVLGSEGVTVVVKHDCCIDCTQHRNSW